MDIVVFVQHLSAIVYDTMASAAFGRNHMQGTENGREPYELDFRERKGNETRVRAGALGFYMWESGRKRRMNQNGGPGRDSSTGTLMMQITLFLIQIA